MQANGADVELFRYTRQRQVNDTNEDSLKEGKQKRQLQTNGADVDSWRQTR